MGDLQASSPELNGAVLEERPPPLSLSNQAGISAESWQRAEAVTQGIIAQVQPSFVSEERRKAVIDYVQRLIRNSVGCEVFPFGSVPLKTYLPDGDIDLTAFGGMNSEETLANDVCSVLEREDQNRTAEFVVKDVQLIRAEVKLVKCLVQNIVVDISFNQLGGLCTLCFLEQVDRLIGKNHLFKCSIILIKAWCYYESRILGAHHGLISTYALETLVLYIFHLFHSSLNGPLAVLYKFLDYFSKFDWDNYCISLNGPIRISSLPEVVVEAPENGGFDLLLSNDFLKGCVEMFSVPARAYETNSRTFPPKHLNIVDPLKENNNLGRSVSKGNFYRIKSAFTYGARKLGRILSQPEESITEELSKFFSNTLDRHGSGQRPDVQDPATSDGQHGFTGRPTFPGAESYEDNHTICESESSNSSGITGECRLNHEQPLHPGNVKVSGKKTNFSGTINEVQNSANGPAVSENRLSGDAKDLATSILQSLSIANDASKSSAPSAEENESPMGKAHHAPHLYFSSSVMGNGEMRNGNPEWKHQESSGFMVKRVPSGIMLAPTEDMIHSVCNDTDDKHLVTKPEVLSPAGSTYHPLLFSSVAWSSEDLYPSHSNNRASASTAGNPEGFKSLSDLSGDYESHLNSLQHGRLWYEYAFTTSLPSVSPQLHTQFQSKNSWDVIRRSVQFRQDVFSQMNVNGVVPRPVFYPINPPMLPGGAFGMEEMPKPRGTGTYFPNTNHYRDRTLTARGRSQAPARSPRSNGRTSQEKNLPERNCRDRELSQAQFHIHLSGGKFRSSDLCYTGSPENKHCSSVNGSMHLSESMVEFGSFGHPPHGVSATEGGRHPNPGSAPAHNSSVSQAIPGMQGPKPVLAMDQDRIGIQSYQLKDEGDFPPLSDSSGKGLSICMVKKLERSVQ
ncbi:hypothetical protein P3X46_005114 [Hevea brasiliensis]|uniref:Polymerase nucleotidyl transferase domain-containing protein n=1 Tax=Hevea brasiliensis TaxID=3981 RepID=A0ABQ9N1K7_HEVBR|nr:uncharacterized protein LOC110639476 [Hevea brasiliensis]XP_021646150.2 uncharacterized protein LOC110639476 [Hevea brasiliensis]KAJ9185481.1 hypothetical protein P3X46_005114 [Hevea brasiliensis]